MIKYKNQRPSLFNLFFDDFATKELVNNTKPMARVPKANIIENENSFEIQLAAPGATKDDFKVEIDDDLLKISSEIQSSELEKKKTFHRKEFSYQSFARSFRLPDNVDSNKIEASYERGVMTITLPKTKDSKVEKARQIKVG